jgi:hypothetical protein
MGIADIFEALTAKDRPYKKGKTLSESLEILGKFKLNGHIDPDLFDVFIWEKVYLKYAEEYLDAYQIDAVDLSRIPGYTPHPRPRTSQPNSSILSDSDGRLRLSRKIFTSTDFQLYCRSTTTRINGFGRSKIIVPANYLSNHVTIGPVQPYYSLPDRGNR